MEQVREDFVRLYR